MTKLSSEPVASAALVVVAALLALLVAFGVHLSDLQTGAIGTFCAAVLGLAAVVRSKVSPVSKDAV